MSPQKGRRFEADDIISLVIIVGCLCLIGLGKGDNGVIPDILKFSLGIILGRRIQRRPTLGKKNES
jgi:hypothetical protein